MDPQTVLGMPGDEVFPLLAQIAGTPYPAMAAVVGIKVASSVLDEWRRVAIPQANEDFRAAVAAAPGEKKWSAFGADLSRHSAVQYEYSDKVKELDAKLKALKASERKAGTATLIPSLAESQEFSVSLPSPYDLGCLELSSR